MKLIFLYGLPGVGKLTIGKELAKQTNLKLFHNHMVLDLIIDVFGRNTDPIINLREGMWLDFFRQAATSKIDGLIFTFCFDKYLSNDFLQKIENTINDHDTVHYVELSCSQDELQKRVLQSSRKEFYKIRDFDALIKEVRDGSFYVPRIKKDVLRIDTTHLSPEETAGLITRKILNN
jgi:hypothetical protein